MTEVPAITLRPMTAQEYAPWRERQIEEYAADMERNGRFVGDLARRRSEESFASLLPDGIATDGHAILVGQDARSGERIGFLWLGPTEEPTKAYVYNIEVDEPLRGHGYGKALMLAFEAEAAARGFTSVGLNVFGHNGVARGLYESLGYSEVSRQMAKPLPAGGRGPLGGGT